MLGRSAGAARGEIALKCGVSRRYGVAGVAPFDTAGDNLSVAGLLRMLGGGSNLAVLPARDGEGLRLLHPGPGARV